MPHYDYTCKKCGYTFEVFQKIDDEPLKECPKCKGELKRLIGSGCGLIFKGNGFYITDYKRNNNKNNKEKPQDKKDSNSKPGSCSCSEK
ncbi:MAG: zinc ribbon domain-containing protein [Candidatus Omnitrophica bacterium]|nr:zinc ribbon domain-containing protein [Candidatus Omnitrophota bacterium]